MRILMFSWEYPPRIIGGIARHLQGLSEALVKKNCEVLVSTLSHPEAKEYEEVNGVKIYRVPHFRFQYSDFLSSVREFNFTLLEGAYRLINKFGKPNLIHAHDWLVSYSSVCLKHSLDIPLIATIHATEMGRNHGIHNDLQRYIHQREWFLTFEAWKVFTCSEYMKKEVNLAFATPLDKIEVVPNAIDAEKYNIEFEKEPFRSQFAHPEEKIVFYVGRMVREKGVEVLIEAIPKVLSEYPQAKFLIVGGGYNEHLKRRAWELGIYQKVYFTGYVDDETLTKIYKVIDCAVYPSLYEPFGIVALEAMAAGVPVVTSDIGGFKEIVEHTVTGIHTWANNPDSLAWGILQILKNPEYAEKLKREAKKRVKEKFSWEKSAEKAIEIYEAVLKEHRKIKRGKKF